MKGLSDRAIVIFHLFSEKIVVSVCTNDATKCTIDATVCADGGRFSVLFYALQHISRAISDKIGKKLAKHLVVSNETPTFAASKLYSGMESQVIEPALFMPHILEPNYRQHRVG